MNPTNSSSMDESIARKAAYEVEKHRATNTESELREEPTTTRDKIIDLLLQNKYTAVDKALVDSLEHLIAQHTADAVAATEKAYGGCHICYGKGYATVNAQWIGYDTDTDIGSPGGVVRGGNPMSMKYCSCERGKQLEALQARNTHNIEYICKGAHCKCMNLDKKCPNFHNGDHTCPTSLRRNTQ